MSIPPKRRGCMFVLSAPSGAGKSSLCRALIEKDPNIEVSVSATTRPPRPGEVEGNDYFFVSESDFQQRLGAGQFLEHARVFGNYYGTPKNKVEQALTLGKDLLFDIDWQGAGQLAHAMPRDVVRIFILPPNAMALAQRLGERGQDTPQVIAKRMEEAASEMGHYIDAEYVIINDDFAMALGHLKAIVQAERLKRHRYKGLEEFVTELSAPEGG